MQIKTPWKLTMIGILLSVGVFRYFTTRTPTNANTERVPVPMSYDALVVGIPYEDYSGTDEGGVNVLYGTAQGISGVGYQWFDQDSPGVPSEIGDYDRFGYALASGDFNGDKYPDLAIGMPYEDLGGINQGAVYVMYGTATGLTTDGGQWFDQNTPGIFGNRGDYDNFGFALHSGDFNGDTYDDLVIGVPNENLNGIDVGGVTVIHGSAQGLNASESVWIDQASSNVPGTTNNYDRFGERLASGDFNRDGYEDLVIGVPSEDNTYNDVGSVIILYGSSQGIPSSSSQHLRQTMLFGIEYPRADDDRFGDSLAVGDFNRDGHDDLAIGIPGKYIFNDNAGAVVVVFGYVYGLEDSAYWFDMEDPSIPGVVEQDDLFGTGLAAGDFDNDGFADLAIGIPGDSVGGMNRGTVVSMYGSAQGFNSNKAITFNQNDLAIPDVATDNDFFGERLTVGDFDGDGYADLVIGVPYEDLDGSAEGGVNIVYGASTGLDTTNAQLIDQDTAGVPGAPENNDLFGYTLAVLPAPRFDVFIPIARR